MEIRCRGSDVICAPRFCELWVTDVWRRASLSQGIHPPFLLPMTPIMSSVVHGDGAISNSVPDLREFVLNSRHPEPRRAWKGGPEEGLRDTIRWIRWIRGIRGIRG